MTYSLGARCIALMLAASPAFALECETNPAKFTFTSDSPSTFNMGESTDVDRAYAALAGSIGPLGRYSKTGSSTPRATTVLGGMTVRRSAVVRWRSSKGCSSAVRAE